MGKQAFVKGTVVYREGDGANMTIPPGPIEYEESELDVTLSWTEGETRSSTAIPSSDFRRYVADQDITLSG